MQDIFYALCGFVISFLPVIIAARRKHKNTAAIFVLNMFGLISVIFIFWLGLVLWLAALIWAVLNK